MYVLPFIFGVGAFIELSGASLSKIYERNNNKRAENFVQLRNRADEITLLTRLPMIFARRARMQDRGNSRLSLARAASIFTMFICGTPRSEKDALPQKRFFFYPVTFRRCQGSDYGLTYTQKIGRKTIVRSMHYLNGI